MEINIERAHPSDAEGLIEFLRTVGGQSDNLSFGKEGIDISIEAESDFLASMETSSDAIMLLAKQSGRIVGNASLFRGSRRMSHRGELSVCVLKECQNRGIGGRLIEALIDFARENAFDIIDLQVRCDNASAIHLYERYGFEKVGTHPSFFKIDGKDIPFYFMCLKLN